MPHKFKKAREHQRQYDGREEDSQDGTYPRPDKSAINLTLEKEIRPPSETLAMEGKYAKIESSPLPLQRALLSSAVSRKCGPITPVPSWKMYDIPFQSIMESASSDANPSLLMRGIAARQSRSERNTVSARKLAASLWEMQGALNASSRQGNDELKSGRQRGMVHIEYHNNGKKGSPEQFCGGDWGQCAEDKGGSSKHPNVGKSLPKAMNLPSSGSPISQEVSRSVAVDTLHLQEEDGSTISRELVKVLNQIWSLEEQYNGSAARVASLRTELKKTRVQIKELQKEQSSYDEGLDMLNRKLADEKTMLQGRAEEATVAAVKPFREELEIERKSKVKLEVKHKKLSKDMNEIRKTLTKTRQEFEREKKARELMEDVCDELAREIGEDKAQVEELKRQSAKYREEVEQERRMLQMAEVWREERVHMKLAEARFELEEKNTALDKLRSELEAFLRAKRSLDEGNNSNSVSKSEQAASSTLRPGDERIQGGQQLSRKEGAPVGVLLDEKRSRHSAGELEGEDLLDDDLHSIELNRISYSGSHEGPLSAKGNSMNLKAFANGRSSPADVASFSHSGSGVTNRRQEEISKFSPDRTASRSGEGMKSESSTSEIRQIESRSSGRGSEGGLKDWDLGKGPVAWSTGVPTSLWQGSTEDGVRPNAKVRTGFGQLGNLSRSGSKGETTGAADRMTSMLEIFELPKHRSSEAHDAGGFLSLGSEAAAFPSSPTRKWMHSSSSSDPAKSSKASQSIDKAGQGFKDNSLKARLLEAKLESQKAKARNSKGASVS
ncbi:hypothetical protein L7F22_046499 [Adiantum nelumboides]|nr:hypothetical protein [Adiantum nelumboides]